MASDISKIISSAFNFALEVFGKFISSAGWWSYFISFFMIFLITRFLILPLVGAFSNAGASDSVKQSNSLKNGGKK